MEDLFEREQTVLNHALYILEQVEDGKPCQHEEYAVLVKEYKRVLKQLRRVTKISDKTTVDLNTSKLDLQDKVHYDELTGIYNRRFLDENLNRIVRSLARSRGVLSVLMLDVDFFKRYNDTYGHSKGDECLRAVAQATNGSTFRSDDFTARYGGEEFVVVLPNTDTAGAQIMASRILDNIRACRIEHKKNDAASYVTASIGITTGEVESSHTMEDYINMADKALYLSKQNGRDRSTFIRLEEEL